MTTKKIVNYTWSQFDKDMVKMARLIRTSNRAFKNIWGPARGGLPITVCLSHALNLPLAEKPTKATLIVDDIADTGKTLGSFAARGFFIAAIFYHRQSVFVPNIWLREKKDAWVVFPWEKFGKNKFDTK